MMRACAVFLLCLALGSAERGEQRSHERHALELTSDGHLVGGSRRESKVNTGCGDPDLPCGDDNSGPSPTPAGQDTTTPCPDDGDAVSTTTTEPCDDDDGTDGKPGPSPTPPAPTPTPPAPQPQPTPVPAPSGKTCDEVASNKACSPGGFCRTCKERYDWLTGKQLSEDMAKDAVAKEFPSECGACATGVLSKTVPEQHGTDGAFICGKGYRSFQWTRRASDNIKDTILKPLNYNWPNPFGVSADDVHNWVNNELLTTNPFGDKGVLVPWPQDDDDQLGHGGWVGYSRRQVCYITAQFILGANVVGYEKNGLNTLMSRTWSKCGGKGDWRTSWAYFLASCAADPGLKNGKQGPLILVAKGKDTPPVEDARKIAKTAKMDGAGLRICDYDTGVQTPSGLAKVPSEGCAPISRDRVGKDFMTGGPKGQVTQDISAQWFGGYLLDSPHACGLGGGQDERLSVYFPEVTILAYFLSQHNKYPMIRQPSWFLGTRYFFTNLDGTARFDRNLQLAQVPLDSDLVDVEVAGKKFRISSSRPVTVFMSENQGWAGGDNVDLVPARKNRDGRQRDVSRGGKFSFEKQVRAWYRSVALTSYSHEIHPAMKTLVKTIGSGPWGAGLWWGDSQVGFLASWIGQAIAATTWGQPFGLDQYIYSSFTENPGNQCLLHSSSSCRTCMTKCYMPRSSYWMPRGAYYNGQPCFTGSQYCGNVGIEKVVADYSSGTAEKLWNTIESKVTGDTRQTIFEIISR